MMETRGIEPLTPALQTYGCTPGTRIMQVQATRQLSELSLMDANTQNSMPSWVPSCPM